MGSFVRGETDLLSMTVDGNISSASNIELWIDTFNETFKKNKTQLTGVSYSNGKTNVQYRLTQYESLSCCEDFVSVQLRWITSNGTVEATKRQLIAVDGAGWDRSIPVTPPEEGEDPFEDYGAGFSIKINGISTATIHAMMQGVDAT